MRAFSAIFGFFLILFCPIGIVIAAAPNVQGSVEIDVEVGDVLNYAQGVDSVAQIAIASVSEGGYGSINLSVSTGDVINYAAGLGSCAQIMIGSLVPSCIVGSVVPGAPAPVSP